MLPHGRGLNVDDSQAKASLGFGPSTALEDITDEKMQIKFGQKLAEVSSEVLVTKIFSIYSQN